MTASAISICRLPLFDKPPVISRLFAVIFVVVPSDKVAPAPTVIAPLRSTSKLPLFDKAFDIAKLPAFITDEELEVKS